MPLKVIWRSNTELTEFLAFFRYAKTHSGNILILDVIRGRYRSLEVTWRPNTEFVAATVLPGFLAFFWYA